MKHGRERERKRERGGEREGERDRDREREREKYPSPSAAYLAVGRADHPAEDLPKLAHVPVARRQPVHVEDLGVEGGGRVAALLEPAAVELVAPDVLALQDVPGLQGRALAVVPGEPVAFEPA